jgi:NAD(P)H-dependent flavin oxidoreductase YrpB (nitropropane dioxygenase family)
MGDISSPRLAAAVADAGALGMVGLTSAPLAYVEKSLDEMRKRTSGVFGANFLIPGLIDDATGKVDPDFAGVVEAAASRARVVDFFYGEPDPGLVDVVHAGGALVSWQIGSRDEAKAAERVGCDLIVAQGIEAGGHVRGKIGLLALLGEVLDAVRIPVVAAGGIGTGRAMAAALAAGASAVRVGTRFAAAAESEAHPRYVQKLIAAEAKDTVLTEAFSTGWPNAPHRVLRSSVEAAERFSGDVVGERIRPWAPDQRVPVRRFQGTGVAKASFGTIDAMSFWAGESVDGVKDVLSAAEIVRELAGQAENLLRPMRK